MFGGGNMLVTLNTFDTKDLIVLIIAILILISLIALCNFRLFKKHISHALYYHRYNKALMKYEKKLNISLKSKRIHVTAPNRISYNDIARNIENFDIINENCIDLINAHNKSSKKRIKDIGFDLDALQELPKLIDVRGYNDVYEDKLIKDILKHTFIKRKLPTIDRMLIKCFGDESYFTYQNSVIFVLNDRLIKVNIDKNKLIKPRTYHFDDITIAMEHLKKTRLLDYYHIAICYDEEILFTKNIKCLTKHSDIYKTILDLSDSLDMYQNCSNIVDALNKYKHIEKVNENTINKIETMSSRKFMSWIQYAFKSIYKTDVELKSDENYGYYLLMQPSEKHGSVVVIVRRHQDKISSSSIKTLKEIQTKENTDEAWLITNSDYTRNSISLAETLNIKLLDKSDLEHIVNKYNTNYYQGF